MSVRASCWPRGTWQEVRKQLRQPLWPPQNCNWNWVQLLGCWADSGATGWRRWRDSGSRAATRYCAWWVETQSSWPAADCQANWWPVSWPSCCLCPRGWSCCCACAAGDAGADADDAAGDDDADAYDAFGAGCWWRCCSCCRLFESDVAWAAAGDKRC